VIDRWYLFNGLFSRTAWVSWLHIWGGPKNWTFIYISQGSVATHLRCGGVLSDSIIANFLLILTVKFRKLVNIS